MKKKIALIFMMFLTSFVYAQDEAMLNVTGQGLTNLDAKKNAFKKAIEKAYGVSVSGETKSKNFRLVESYIETHTEGYIKTYKNESTWKQSDIYYYKADITVTKKGNTDLESVKDQMGGFKFVVFYDDRGLKDSLLSYTKYTYDRIQEKLTDSIYNTVAAELYKEPHKIISEETIYGDVNYKKRIGVHFNSDFLIFIDNISINLKKENGSYRANTRIDIKLWDVSVMKELSVKTISGNMIGDSENEAVEYSIRNAVDKEFAKIMNVFKAYCTSCVDEGRLYTIKICSNDIDFYDQDYCEDFFDNLKQYSGINSNPHLNTLSEKFALIEDIRIKGDAYEFGKAVKEAIEKTTVWASYFPKRKTFQRVIYIIPKAERKTYKEIQQLIKLATLTINQ